MFVVGIHKVTAIRVEVSFVNRHKEGVLEEQERIELVA
jgi:hypothetical protein